MLQSLRVATFLVTVLNYTDILAAVYFNFSPYILDVCLCIYLI